MTMYLQLQFLVVTKAGCRHCLSSHLGILAPCWKGPAMGTAVTRKAVLALGELPDSCALSSLT